MKPFLEYLKKRRKFFLFFLMCVGILESVFLLYRLPWEPVIYGAILCLMAGSPLFFYSYLKYRKKQKLLLEIQKDMELHLLKLPEPEDGNEVLYQEMLLKMNEKRMGAESCTSQFYGELTDYYSMWVHQIKTPIAALRLLLLAEPDTNRDALTELFKVEQYVEMVLGYLRTEDMASDMRFQEYSLDEIIREQIHKYARIFVTKKIALVYEGTEEKVLTDKKWLGFVLGQILSNALKYTGKGSITITVSHPHTLVIKDTGIGIKKEDIPRVFERGYTGYNGRKEHTSTGIGLYLSAKIMKKLGHGISIESELGEGTKVSMFLGRRELELY